MEQVHIEPFKVIGVPVRTSNIYDKSIVDVGITWLHFEEQGLFYKIPNRTSDNMHVVYTDHEPGIQGEFTAIISCKVSSLDDIPKGMVGKEIPGGDYIKYSVHGMADVVVGNKWRELWKQDAVIPRNYGTDFDEYKGGYPLNIGNTDVDIFVEQKK